MAMAESLLVIVPCTTAAFTESTRGIRGHCEQRNVGVGRLVSGCGVKLAINQGSSRAVSSSCRGLRLTATLRRSVRPEQLGWRGCSHFLAVDGYRICSRRNVHYPRKLLQEAVRKIAAERFDPKNFDPKKIDTSNVISTLLKLGKQGFEAGTKLVPDTVPRPLAQLGVALAGLFVGSFVVRSLFSTVFFILAIGGLGYIAFLFLTKGEGGSSSGKNFDRDSGKPKSTDEALEEARRIMDKYK